MCAYGRGWHRGSRLPRMTAPSGYAYVGPCRCGMGPHAFYQNPAGRMVHVWDLPNEDIESGLEALKEEKVALEKQIEEMERLTKARKE